MLSRLFRALADVNLHGIDEVRVEFNSKEALYVISLRCDDYVESKSLTWQELSCMKPLTLQLHEILVPLVREVKRMTGRDK